jgi:hypothetical protein
MTTGVHPTIPAMQQAAMNNRPKRVYFIFSMGTEWPPRASPRWRTRQQVWGVARELRSARCPLSPSHGQSAVNATHFYPSASSGLFAVFAAVEQFDYRASQRHIRSRLAATSGRPLWRALVRPRSIGRDYRVATAACLPVLVLIGYWLLRRRIVGGVAQVAPGLLPVGPIMAPIVDTERGRMS